MASVYRKTYRDYDKDIMSQEDYGKIQSYKNDYNAATDDAGRKQAHDNAANLRAQYGYSMGDDGSEFSILNPTKGVSQETNAMNLRYNNPANNPTGQSDLYKQWTGLLDQYTNRQPFTYDLTSDALYQQYAQQYKRLGNQAMQDTLGQAAGLTGGYSSSYAQNAGQQAYQGYLDQLNDIVPELYGQAYDVYTQEGNNLLQAAQMAGQAYGQEVNDYWNNANYWQQMAAAEQGQYWNQMNYDQGQREFEAAQQQYNEQFASQQKQQYYSNLVTAISNTGYSPTDTELAAAGMTREEANRWANYYAMQNAATGGSGGSGGRRSGGGGNPKADDTPAADRVQSLAASYAASNPSGYLDSRSLDMYLNESGLSTQEKAKFKEYLQTNHGWGYSRNI